MRLTSVSIVDTTFKARQSLAQPIFDAQKFNKLHKKKPFLVIFAKYWILKI
jgi:hypothetical protein